MEISIESLPFNKKHQLYGNEATFIRDDGTHHKHPRKSDDDNTWEGRLLELLKECSEEHFGGEGNPTATTMCPSDRNMILIQTKEMHLTSTWKYC